MSAETNAALTVADPVSERDGSGTPAPSSLQKLAVSGSAWTVIGTASLSVLRLAGNLVITRLVAPEAFGLAAIVTVILMGLELMSDVGLGPVIVQHKRGDDPRFLNTAWTIQVIRGLILALLAAAAAWPLAIFYEEPRLLGLIPFAGLSAVFAGFNSTAMHTATRKLRLARLTILQVVSQITGIVAMIVWALISPTVWALVAGGLVMAVMRAILSHTFLGGMRNRFAWEAEARTDLFHFGKWIFINTGLYFWATQGDRILLGKLVTFAQVGVYQIGFYLSQPIVMLNFQFSKAVFMPVLSEVYRKHPEQMKQVYYRTRIYSDLILIPLLGIAMTIATPVVEFLYDERYWQAGPLLQIFLVQAVLRCVLEPGETCILALGVPKRLTITHLCRTVGILVGVPVGLHLYGLPGVAWAVSLAELPVLVLVWKCLSERGIFSLLRETIPLLALAGGLGLGKLLLLAVSSL